MLVGPQPSDGGENEVLQQAYQIVQVKPLEKSPNLTNIRFLGATKHLYKSVCPSVRPSVGP